MSPTQVRTIREYGNWIGVGQVTGSKGTSLSIKYKAQLCHINRCHINQKIMAGYWKMINTTLNGLKGFNYQVILLVLKRLSCIGFAAAVNLDNSMQSPSIEIRSNLTKPYDDEWDLIQVI
ncbi:hypothetical protein TNCT_560341 [Trichonephila clavata]|uniref:Uncharacterized protein n=1 Tax=Trichonephila clavata TaxID=2740835 RepID=A0A8X6L3Z8_TRICU|nr:hypothetical protein TNCT_560341 [Trichonephila clavata]